MKKFFQTLVFLLFAMTANADFVIMLPSKYEGQKILVMAEDISSIASSKSRRDVIRKMDTLTVENNTLKVSSMMNVPACYSIGTDKELLERFYAAPDDKLVIDISTPEAYSASGSTLIEQTAVIKNRLRLFQAEATEAYRNGDKAEAKEIQESQDNYLSQYITTNASAPGAAYALLRLEEAKMLVKLAPALEGAAKECVIYPLVVKAVSQAEEQMARDERQASLEGALAPDFTLAGLDGKMRSLSDYRGKWVILDFWGSWCPWCIKGFPDLKELYGKYGRDKLEIIGIDCRESEDAWRRGVEKHQLPWVQLYNPKNGNATDLYGVSGYPTKVVVSPDGKVRKIDIGHNVDFVRDFESMVQH